MFVKVIQKVPKISRMLCYALEAPFYKAFRCRKRVDHRRSAYFRT